MKKIIVILLILFIPIILVGCAADNKSYLRVHIRANSNSIEDQNVKYFAKDAIVAYLTPQMQLCESKQQVIDVLNDNMSKMVEVVNEVLKEHGFNYDCSIEIDNEFFPTRTYDNLTLQADYYDALIVKLGTGEGDNWWCVMYPNLCFNEPSNVVYKSKIMEIINKIRG